jgi:hypothetical protein
VGNCNFLKINQCNILADYVEINNDIYFLILVVLLMIARTFYSYDNIMDMIYKYVKNSQLFRIEKIIHKSKKD